MEVIDTEIIIICQNSVDSANAATKYAFDEIV